MTHGLRVWRAEAHGRRHAELAALPDETLLQYARQGETAAFGELYSRHRVAARRLARRLVQGRVEADDVVAETFARVLRVLQRGGGPVDGFRVYLLTAVRRTAWYLEDRERRELAVEPVALDVAGDDGDLVAALAERGLMTRAFASLPERWRVVLWHTEVEGEPARQVARILGISPNGVAALSYRARGALRAAYLQAHVADPPTEGCRPFAAKLGGYTMSRGRSVDRDRIAEHLADCAGCRERAAELRDVRSTLRSVAGPVLLGPAAVAYLAPSKVGLSFGALLQHGKITTAATVSGAASGEAVAQLVTHHGRISVAVAGAALTATGALGFAATEPAPEASSPRAVITAVRTSNQPGVGPVAGSPGGGVPGERPGASGQHGPVGTTVLGTASGPTGGWGGPTAGTKSTQASSGQPGDPGNLGGGPGGDPGAGSGNGAGPSGSASSTGLPYNGDGGKTDQPSSGGTATVGGAGDTPATQQSGPVTSSTSAGVPAGGVTSGAPTAPITTSAAPVVGGTVVPTASPIPPWPRKT